MKRRGKALGMALLLIMMTVFSVVSDAAMVKADELLIKLHYHRADDNYVGCLDVGRRCGWCSL